MMRQLRQVALLSRLPRFNAVSAESNRLCMRRRAMLRELLRGFALGGAVMLAPGALQASPKLPRTVVMGGALAEWVCELGARDAIVGADTTCTWPASLASVPKIGYERMLGAEGILSLQPQLVLATDQAGPPAVFEILERAGVMVVRVPSQHDAASARLKLQRCAAALGLQEAGRKRAAEFDSEWRRTIDYVKSSNTAAGSTPPPRLLFMWSRAGRQPVVAGLDTAANAMFELAGARNAVQSFKQYRPLSAEALLSIDPDLIVTTAGTVAPGREVEPAEPQSDRDEESSPRTGATGAHRVNRANQVTARSYREEPDPGNARLTDAWRGRRVIVIDELMYLGFGPRMPQAVRDLNLATRESLRGNRPAHLDAA
jgi:iron complex transport system substrate-binding protein